MSSPPSAETPTALTITCICENVIPIKENTRLVCCPSCHWNTKVRDGKAIEHEAPLDPCRYTSTPY
jgi:hypothetical protein